MAGISPVVRAQLKADQIHVRRAEEEADADGNRRDLIRQV